MVGREWISPDELIIIIDRLINHELVGRVLIMINGSPPLPFPHSTSTSVFMNLIRVASSGTRLPQICLQVQSGIFRAARPSARCFYLIDAEPYASAGEDLSWLLDIWRWVFI